MSQENTQETAVVARTKRIFTNEEIVAIETTVETIAPIMSEDFNKVAKLVSAWHTEGRKEAIAEVVEEFGGEVALKDFVNGDLSAEMAKLAAIVEVTKVLVSAAKILGREKKGRKPRLKKGGAKITVTIDGKLGQVNAEYFQTLADMAKEEKIELIKNHPSYVELVQAEVL